MSNMNADLSRLKQRLDRLLPKDSLRARASIGAAWTLGGMIASQLLRLISNLVLTRLLFPEAFGMMALVQVFITGLVMFSDFGTQASIIQNDKSTQPGFLNTAWTLQVIRGFILWIIISFIALPIASFYDEPMLAMLLPIAGLTALIAGFTPTRVYTANRDLLLARVTLIDIASQLVSIVFMIALAWIFKSVWALVTGAIVGAIFKQVLLMIAMPGHRNRIQIEISSLGELFHFGKWIFLSTLCGFLVNHFDRALLAKFITLEMLGIYMIGFFLANIPLKMGQPLANKVVFPLYKKIPPWENLQNKSKIFKMRWYLSGCLLFFSAFLAISGDFLVKLLYDSRYELAGPILVLMAISQIPMVILCSYGKVLLAAGDSKRYMTRIAITAFIQTTLLVIGITQLGLIGAIVAPGLAAIVAYPLLVSSVRRYSAWDAKHDVFYAIVGVLITIIAVMLNHDAIHQLLIFSRFPQ
ncbi:MAG: oligosaccharide flippase family protein [Methylophaga sp.]|nr:oligosaccharide flippase family protein [Methylophaga sp.]